MPRLAEGQKILDSQTHKSPEVGSPKIAQSGSHICKYEFSPSCHSRLALATVLFIECKLCNRDYLRLSIEKGKCITQTIASNNSYYINIEIQVVRFRIQTYTTLKSSTEFMQQFVSSLSLACVEGVREEKQRQVMKLVEAKAELREVQEQMDEATAFAGDEDDEEAEDSEKSSEQSDIVDKLSQREEELMQIITNQGFDPTTDSWDGAKLRIYFPDEGSAALARRDWKSEVPSCVEFSACGGVQVADTSKDAVILFFCPRASEAEFVEEILYKMEEQRGDVKETVGWPVLRQLIEWWRAVVVVALGVWPCTAKGSGNGHRWCRH